MSYYMHQVGRAGAPTTDQVRVRLVASDKTPRPFVPSLKMRRSNPKHFLDRKETIAACSLKNNQHLNQLIDQGRFFMPIGRVGNKQYFAEGLVRAWAEEYHLTGAIPTNEDIKDIALVSLIATYENPRRTRRA